MNNIINPFYQIQNLLNEVNAYVYKINQIILQINNIINLNLNNNNSNNFLFNNRINKANNLINMNNFMNMMNQMNNNMNDDILINKKKENINYAKVTFIKVNGPKTELSIDNNKTVNELLNIYFQKNNRFEFIDNYEKNFVFLFNAIFLNEKKNEIIKDMNIRNHSVITVIEEVIEENHDIK